MCDKDTAYQYGIVKNKLLDKGKPIPENPWMKKFIWHGAPYKLDQT